jgi:hypothetical protein
LEFVREVKEKIEKNDGIIERTMGVVKFTSVVLGVGLGFLNMPTDDSYVVLP